MDHLLDLVHHYERFGYFQELIAVLEQGINLERSHQGMYTQLGVLYAKYKEEKLMEHGSSNNTTRAQHQSHGAYQRCIDFARSHARVRCCSTAA